MLEIMVFFMMIIMNFCVVCRVHGFSGVVLLKMRRTWAFGNDMLVIMMIIIYYVSLCCF